MKKDLEIIFRDNKHIGFYPSIRFIEYHIELEEIESSLQKKIKEKVLLEKEFELGTEILVQLYNAYESRIENLLKHPDFDPYKREERKSYKEQFESNPFEWKGKKYFLYPRMEYEIDKQIQSANMFFLILKEQIPKQVPLRFTFKEYTQ